MIGRVVWRVVRWALAFGISLVVGGGGAVIGMYAGLYLRSLLLALVLAWVGFTVSAYAMFLLSGVILRINTGVVMFLWRPR